MKKLGKSEEDELNMNINKSLINKISKNPLTNNYYFKSFQLIRFGNFGESTRLIVSVVITLNNNIKTELVGLIFDYIWAENISFIELMSLNLDQLAYIRYSEEAGEYYANQILSCLSKTVEYENAAFNNFIETGATIE